MLSSSKIIESHIDKDLKIHLQNVTNNSQVLLKEAIPTINRFIADVQRIISVTHDFGKANAFFQERLHDDNKPMTKEATHSFLSSTFTFTILEKYFESVKPNGDFESIPSEFFIILGTIIVKDHHRKMENLTDAFQSFISTQENRYFLMKQFNTLNEEFAYKKLEECYNDLLKKHIIQLESLDFDELFKKVHNLIKQISGLQTREDHFTTPMIRPLIAFNFKKFCNEAYEEDKRILLFLIGKLLNSCLLEADKMDAAFDSEYPLPMEDETIKIFENAKRRVAVLQKKGILNHKKMNQMRIEIFEEIENQLAIRYKERSVFSINAPTGVGKTLSTINAIFNLMNKISIKNQWNKRIGKAPRKELPRVIYCLPFLSITDQIHSEFLNLVPDGSKNNAQMLICHHHKSDVTYTMRIDGKDVEMRGSDANLLIEGWQSDTVITTFHQFLNIFFSNHNTLNRRFNKISHSIVVLDEVQCIPLKYWLLVRKIFQSFVGYFNSNLFLVSATLPMILPENNVIELLENKQIYFDSLDRINIVLHLKNVLTIIEFFKTVEKQFNLYNALKRKNFLFVFNTRRSARDFHNLIKCSIKNQDLGENIHLEFLSSDVLPINRKNRLECISKRIKNNWKRLLLISTQVIEAGIDLDFDIVFRDFAPLDSLIQVAGRCNRHSSNGVKGEFHVFRLRKDNEKEFSKYIYDEDLLYITKEILLNCMNTYGSGNILAEKYWFLISNQYYQEIQRITTKAFSKQILKDVLGFSYQEVARKFRLIEEKQSINLFLDINDESHELWERYWELKHNKKLKPFEKKTRFLQFKNNFQNYTINSSVNKEELLELGKLLNLTQDELEKQLIFIPSSLSNNLYDECGFHIT